MKVLIKDIRVRARIRRDPGDLTALKESMRRLGLLQPILVDNRINLLAGYRRLEAARLLGWESIEVRVVDAEKKQDRLRIETEENTTRKEFTREEEEHAERLLERHGRTGIFWRFIAWFQDLFDRIFRR